MAMRFGPGPVFAAEWRAASRRWQGYATRAAFVAALLAGMGVAWLAEGGAATGPNGLAAVGRMTTMTIVGVQLAMVLMIAPASTAGSVCNDRASGTLTLMLTTDLSSAEVVLGKLAARLVPVLGLVLCSLPVAALATLLGGADPDALVRAAIATLAVAVLGGAAGVLASVWAGRAQEALMAVFLGWAAWMLAGPTIKAFAAVPTRVDMLHPFLLVLAPFGTSGRGGWGDVLVFVGGVAAASAVLMGAAIASVRPAERRGSGVREAAKPRRRGGWPARAAVVLGKLGPSPSLDGNPVLWREWHRRRPSRWGRAIWWIYGLASAAFTAAAMPGIAGMDAGWRFDFFRILGLGFQASIGLLLLAVSASTSMAEERARGSLDVLMASPLPSAAIVWGKWWGAMRPLPWLAVPAVLIPGAVSLQTGRWIGPAIGGAMMLAYGVATISLGIAVATRVRRPGRAVALTVGLYLVPTAGWFFLLLALSNTPTGAYYAIGSPFYGPIFGLLCAGSPEWGGVDGLEWAAPAAWFVAFALAATLLQASTLMGFDRRLGRMPEGVNAPPPGPPRRVARGRVRVRV